MGCIGIKIDVVNEIKVLENIKIKLYFVNEIKVLGVIGIKVVFVPATTHNLTDAIRPTTVAGVVEI